MEEEMYSSKREVQDFTISNTWKDITEIVQDRIKSVRDQLENEIEMDLIKFHQGRVQECRVFLDLPEIILEGFEDEKQRKEYNERK